MKIELFTFGISTELVKAARWNAEFCEWEINYKTILETYKTMHINPNGIKLSSDQEARRWKMHFERESEFWERTKDCWHIWSNDKLLFQAVETGVEQYLQQAPVEKARDDTPEQHEENTSSKKGRPKQGQWLNGDASQQAETLQRLKREIGTKKAKQAYIVLFAAWKAGLLTEMPNSRTACQCFPSVKSTSYKNAQKYKELDDFGIMDQEEVELLIEKFRL